MAPGETLEMRFATERVHDGFSTRGADTRLVKNGTFLNNAEFAPQLGFDRSALLQDRSTRRKYDLPAELRMPKLEDDSARDRDLIGARRDRDIRHYPIHVPDIVSIAG